MNCPKCRREMEMLRDVSNTRYSEFVRPCKCGFLLTVWGNPNAILGLALKRLSRSIDLKAT